jgi:hypothetical protein
MGANELHHSANLVKGGDHEVDAHVAIAIGLQLANELTFGRVVEHHGRSLNVLGQVIDGPAPNHLPKAEDSLRPRDLGVEKLRTHGVPLARSAEGPTDRCEEDFRMIGAR